MAERVESADVQKRDIWDVPDVRRPRLLQGLTRDVFEEIYRRLREGEPLERIDQQIALTTAAFCAQYARVLNAPQELVTFGAATLRNKASRKPLGPAEAQALERMNDLLGTVQTDPDAQALEDTGPHMPAGGDDDAEHPAPQEQPAQRTRPPMTGPEIDRALKITSPGATTLRLQLARDIMASSDRNEKRLISALMICNGIAASAAEQTEIRRQANELAEELCGQIETFLRLKKKMDTDDQRVWSQVQQMRTTIDQRRMLIG